jgi:hypothetical protein
LLKDASPASQTDQHPDENEEVKDLTRLQEEHFLALFWQWPGLHPIERVDESAQYN